MGATLACLHPTHENMRYEMAFFGTFDTMKSCTAFILHPRSVPSRMDCTRALACKACIGARSVTCCGSWVEDEAVVHGECHGCAGELNDGQKAAVLKASTAPLVVLTGGPGCGKTFATKAIVQLWQSQGKDIRLAAPTGASLVPFPLYTHAHRYSTASRPPDGCAWVCPHSWRPTMCLMSRSIVIALVNPLTGISCPFLRRQSGPAAAGGGRQQGLQGHDATPPPRLQVARRRRPAHRRAAH